MSQAVERNIRIVQLDECYVTKNTVPKRAWSPKLNNILLDYKEVQNEVQAVIAAVSRERGLDHVEVFRHSVTKRNFKVFLEGLRQKYLYDDILIM